jgi:hypothetical protein
LFNSIVTLSLLRHKPNISPLASLTFSLNSNILPGNTIKGSDSQGAGAGAELCKGKLTNA